MKSKLKFLPLAFLIFIASCGSPSPLSVLDDIEYQNGECRVYISNDHGREFRGSFIIYTEDNFGLVENLGRASYELKDGEEAILVTRCKNPTKPYNRLTIGNK